MARSGRGGDAGLAAAYQAMAAEIERRVDVLGGEGSYRAALERLVAWHAAPWFAAGAAKGGLPDPLKREEEAQRLVKPWVEAPSLCFTQRSAALAHLLGLDRAVGLAEPWNSLAEAVFGLRPLGATLAEVPGDLTARCFVCLDYLRGQAERGGVADFLTAAAQRLPRDGTLVIADDLSFQDDAVECLVALDFEILDLKSVSACKLVALRARR